METRAEEWTNVEIKLESIESERTKETLNQPSESALNRVGSQDRSKHSKLVNNGIKISKLRILYCVLFLIFFSFNVSYYIGPRVSSPAFASYQIEETSATTWPNITSTVLSLLEKFVPDSSDRLAEFFPNVTAGDSRYQWYYDKLCLNKTCVKPDIWDGNIFIALMALKAAQEGKVDDLQKYFSKFTHIFSGVRKEAEDKIKEFERYHRDYDASAARLIKGMEPPTGAARPFVEIGFWFFDAIVLLMFIFSYIAARADDVALLTVICIVCLIISTIFTCPGIVKPPYPGVLEENAIGIKQGGLVIKFIILVVLQLIFIVSSIVYNL